MSARLRLVTPRNDFRSVPVRPANSELRTREYLTPAEIKKLIKAAKDGRWGHRDATLVLVAFRHGLRASEIGDLEWSQVEFGRAASLRRMASQRYIRCVATKSGHCGSFSGNSRIASTCSPLSAAGRSPRTPSTGTLNGLASGLALISQCHGCGYALANAGHDTRAIQDWLGHRSIQHTVRYTELARRASRTSGATSGNLRRFGHVDCCTAAAIFKLTYSSRRLKT